MEQGGKLTISTRAASAEAVQIVVADTGPGFSQEALEHLFEDGFTTKRARGGSGHGLPSLAVFVAGVGGSIEVESGAGDGATVTVTLPTADLGGPDADVSD
jgi:signal transduction histidine kinase